MQIAVNKPEDIKIIKYCWSCQGNIEIKSTCLLQYPQKVHTQLNTVKIPYSMLIEMKSGSTPSTIKVSPAWNNISPPKIIQSTLTSLNLDRIIFWCWQLERNNSSTPGERNGRQPQTTNTSWQPMSILTAPTVEWMKMKMKTTPHFSSAKTKK